MSNFTDLSAITVGDRTRELDLSHRDELIRDIRKNGLLQPLIVGDRLDFPLIDGLHRMEALKILFTTGELVFYDGEPLAPNQAPFVRFDDLDPARLLEVEIGANIFRKELTWQERTSALNRLHRLQTAANPAATFNDTAAKLAGVTGKSEETMRKAVSRATVIAEAMEANPELANARSETEAFSRVKSDITRIATSLLASGFTATESLHTLYEGDMKNILPQLIEGEKRFSLILADPPYGVGADTWGSKFLDAPHDYDDTFENALKLATLILSLGLQVTEPTANLFMFCAIEHWHKFRTLSEDLGWSAWPHPVIWHKSNEGIRPWGQKGYAYCYEAILFATKGQKGLIKTGPDVISGIYKVRGREHGAAKPPALYRTLIESTCLPGDHVLDPCCGAGTIFTAATLSSTIATGIELNPHFVGLAREKLSAPKEEEAQMEFDAL